MQKVPFITLEQARQIIADVPTPFHIYDEKGIRENARRLYKAFSWNKGFKEYFAVKATPNPYLMQILKEEGCGMDCSSYTELVLSEACGITGHNDTVAVQRGRIDGVVELPAPHFATVLDVIGLQQAERRSVIDRIAGHGDTRIDRRFILHDQLRAGHGIRRFCGQRIAGQFTQLRRVPLTDCKSQARGLARVLVVHHDDAPRSRGELEDGVEELGEEPLTLIGHDHDGQAPHPHSLHGRTPPRGIAV